MERAELNDTESQAIADKVKTTLGVASTSRESLEVFLHLPKPKGPLGRDSCPAGFVLHKMGQILERISGSNGLGKRTELLDVCSRGANFLEFGGRSWVRQRG